ncbi:MAG: ABC transporter ATP-binding protein [Betaproteobacteria bacterium]
MNAGAPRKSGVDVVVDGVSLAYGANVVLRDISLDIAPGEFFALLGPSGSGKSTLLRLLAGFNRANSGQVRIGGADVAMLPPWKRDVGMVFQNYALWPHMTVAENVAFGLEERRWPRARIRERVREVLDLVSLKGFDARRPGELSGGQQQRVAIARTLAIEPSVLLLDEPLSNLDAKLRAATGLELKRLQRRLGITTLFVTHDQQEAMTIADRLAVLDQGVIQQVGTPRELYDTPVNRFVAEFVGSINIYPARIETGADSHFVVAIDGLGRARVPAPRVAGAAVTAAAGGRAIAAAFRPHAVRVVESAVADDLEFDAEVRTTEFLGEFVRHELAAGAHTVVVDLPHKRFSEALVPGMRARFAVSPAEILVLDDPPR